MADMNYAGIVLPDGKSYQTAGEYVPYSTTVSTPMSDASVQNLAPAYDATSTYSVGDWCVYGGTLYQCNTDIATAEAFDATKWDAKKIVDMTGSDIPVSSSSSETIADMLDSLSATSTENIATQISNTYGVSNVMASIKKIGKIGVLSVQFTSTNAVSSGVCILTTSIKSNGQVNSALGGLQGGGFIQYNEDNFVIRCTATGGNYLCGQLVFQVL